MRTEKEVELLRSMSPSRIVEMFLQKHFAIIWQDRKDALSVHAGTLLPFHISRVTLFSKVFLQERWTCFAHNSLVCTALLDCISILKRSMLPVALLLLTIKYGTRYRCCQPEGWRRQDYDCHQPGRFLRGR